MIKGVLFCILLSLVGCGTLYDAKEYESYIKIATIIDQSECSNTDLQNLVNESRYLFRYSFHKSNEQETIEANYTIYQSLMDLQRNVERGNVTHQYCLLKLQAISALVGQYAEIVSNRPR